MFDGKLLLTDGLFQLVFLQQCSSANSLRPASIKARYGFFHVAALPFACFHFSSIWYIFSWNSSFSLFMAVIFGSWIFNFLARERRKAFFCHAGDFSISYCGCRLAKWLGYRICSLVVLGTSPPWLFFVYSLPRAASSQWGFLHSVIIYNVWEELHVAKLSLLST